MSAPAVIDVRPITEAEHPEWLRAMRGRVPAGNSCLRAERAGAGREADALLRTSRRAWCPDMF
ncbi:hypothetical protein ACFYZ2_19480 [Streptomyces sviceus]|uniref:hypothetical protein n=1 Tax=Streptomyces sviceus TaxID=285530 RepID=UPI00367A427B